MSRVNLFACSSSLDNENSHSNGNNLSSMEVVGDSDRLMGKKLFSSKKELQKVLYMEALKKTFEFQTSKSRRTDLLLGVLTIIVSGDSMLLSLEVRIYLKSESTITSSMLLIVRKKNHHHASFKLIAQKICHKFDGASFSYRPDDIREDFQKQFRYEISYHKAWKARE